MALRPAPTNPHRPLEPGSWGAAPLSSPFPWFGGKTRASALIWTLLGDCGNYVEPFFGSGAALFNRPHRPRIETVNDKDAFLVNVFRALQQEPEGVAAWCDFPVNEAQQHAVHSWLVARREEFTARLIGDPDYYDVRVAGYWLYGICTWIGRGWCSGNGAWQSINGQLTRLGTSGQGIIRNLVHLGNAGQGIHRQRVHLRNAGQGIHRQLVRLGNAGQGSAGLLAYFAALQARLRYVRVCCGDWTRILGPSVTWKHGITGILLDPPYATEEGRDMALYREDDGAVAHTVRAWCMQHGAQPLLRIVLCGYGETHDALLRNGWQKTSWTANGGLSNQNRARDNANKYRETLWYSPHCLPLTSQLSLFGQEGV